MNDQQQAGGIVHDPSEYSQIANPMTEATAPANAPADYPVEEEIAGGEPDEVNTVDGGPEPTDETQPETDEVITAPPASIFSWQASEFIHHQKSALWYVVFFLIAALLTGGAAYLQQWFTVAVFAVMTVALVVYANKPPRVLMYELSDKGLTIDGKLFAFTQFRDFAVIQDVAWHSIDLEPTQRFMPRLTILFDNKDFDHIIDILAEQLPRVNRTPDFVEKFTRLVKF